MALFKRKDLQEKGLNEEQIAYIMTEAQRVLGTDYVSKSDSEEAIAKALEGAKSDPTKSDEYLSLLARAERLEAMQGAEFGTIKAPYRDMVWNQLDHGQDHKPYAEQLEGLKSSMPDLFATAQEEPAKPEFGTAPQGSAPTGKETGPSFADVWGFVPKK